jgi:hypothetical protein
MHPRALAPADRPGAAVSAPRRPAGYPYLLAADIVDDRARLWRTGLACRTRFAVVGEDLPAGSRIRSRCALP